MIQWTPYPKGHGCYAEVGSVILEAYHSGSWVMRARPDRDKTKLPLFAPMEGTSADLETAKAIAEHRFRKLLDSVETSGNDIVQLSNS